MNYSISDREFRKFKAFIFDIAGIDLADSKKTMVSSRLAKRLRHYALDSYSEYIELLDSGRYPQESRILTDILTTNETYFFRESTHFDFLGGLLKGQNIRKQKYRVWSAASSTGQEAYSIAMVLADKLGPSFWEVVATDLSSKVLETARVGHYPMMRTEGIPKEYLRRFCLQGTGEYENTLLIDKALRAKVNFTYANLNEHIPDLGCFDCIFLRNVMIYFNKETKRQVVKRILSKLKPGGYIFIGHSENMKGITDQLEFIRPAIYQKLPMGTVSAESKCLLRPV